MNTKIAQIQAIKSTGLRDIIRHKMQKTFLILPDYSYFSSCDGIKIIEPTYMPSEMILSS